MCGECNFEFNQPLGSLNGRMIDSQGETIKDPFCPVCKDAKLCVMGKDTFAWVCLNGCDSVEVVD